MVFLSFLVRNIDLQTASTVVIQKMDDIYGNLENYNDVNALSQLRTENQDLKQRLEECTSTIGKLQKDYDNLTLEFKRLEMNYSSLLKTARAEIERKTHLITNLNLEKDMILIKSFQNGGNFRRIDLKTKQSLYNSNNAVNKNVKDDTYKSNTHHDTYKDRKDKDSCTDSSNRLTNNSDVIDTSKDKKSEFKENLMQERKAIPKRIASSRRKSMSSVRIQDKFNSDDECEQKRKSSSKEIIKNQELPHYKLDRKILDRVHFDRYSNRTSETSSLDERNSNYLESPRENYRNTQSRHCSEDKYRLKERDKYEYSYRYRRHSPDQGYRKVSKEYQEDHYHRTEYGRHRANGSPPLADSYHNHHRRNREYHHSNDRYCKEYEKHRSHYEEKHSFKHKVPNDYEEPSSKRQRIESSSTNDNSHPNEEMKYLNKDIKERMLLGPCELEIQHTSCQSPDYSHTDAVIHPVREIIHTAAIPLEDPRKFCKKYVLKTDAEGRTSISTVSGRDIDLSSIDKSTWNIESITMPDDLVCRPSHFSEDLVKEIYMDIDVPATNISMESGEICLESEDLSSCIKTNLETGNEKQDFGLDRPTTKVCSKSSQPVIKVENFPAFSSANYKIPKIKCNRNIDRYSNKKEREITDNSYNKEREIMDTLDSQKNSIISTTDSKNNSVNEVQTSILGQLIDKHDMILSKKLNESGNRTCESKNANQTHNLIISKKINKTSDKTCESKNASETRNLTVNARTIVEGDLELSDETSDIVEFKETSLKIPNGPASGKDTVIESVNPLTSNVTKNENDKLSEDNDTNINKQENNSASYENTKGNHSKKQKIKKRKSKSRDSKEAVQTDNVEHVPDKKYKSKKEKEKPKKDIENKFNDLFGDSCSLIMPEDLGIGTYVPVFDDAQDAMDLNIKQMKQSAQHDELSNNEQTNQPSSEVKKLDNPNFSSNHQRQGISIESECDKAQNTLIDKKEKICLNSNEEKEVAPDANVAVYENLNPEIVDNMDVVKTVIISTGVQQQLGSNIEPALRRPVVNVETGINDDIAIQNQVVNELKIHDHITALATSTPQKEFLLKNMESSTAESSHDSNIVGIDSVDSIPSTNNQCEKQSVDTMDSLNTVDVPDVRIFVRRRRKVFKKPTAV